MKFYIEKIIFQNRAPFDSLNIDLNENEIAILSASNGRGKTTILSHVADALHEFAKINYANEFEGRENKFYRTVTPTYNLNPNEPSLFYIRMKLGDEIHDYVDIIGKLNQDDYNAIPLENKIPYNSIENQLNKNGSIKYSTLMNKRDSIEKLFENNLATYFPAYRFEQPGYINTPYAVKLKFKTEAEFRGHMINPLEVVSGLPDFANWLMDIIIDMQYPQSNVGVLKLNVDQIITLTLCGKQNKKLRFGVGPRGHGGTRIQIIETETQKCLYPTIFNLSSGEAAILCMFGEIIRQSDNINNNVVLSQTTGVVLIDEVDKHLHIKLQKEVLPKLFEIFPNVQFIISSHSPFLNIGLAETLRERSKIIDLDNFGITRDPTTNKLYTEVYNMMITENLNFKDLYTQLKEKVQSGQSPLVVTEGKTDIQHLSQAQHALDINLDLDYFPVPGDWGADKLKVLLEQLSKVKQARKIIGIFDRDLPKFVADIEKDGRSFKAYGNNVYALCLPTPQDRMAYTNISIEFFYSDDDLKKEKDGKSLYFDNEVAYLQAADNGSERTLIKLPEPEKSKEAKKKIFDTNLGSIDWIHSKARFADLIEQDANFRSSISFENFGIIFDLLNSILEHQEQT